MDLKLVKARLSTSLNEAETLGKTAEHSTDSKKNAIFFQRYLLLLALLSDQHKQVEFGQFSFNNFKLILT